MNSTTFYRRARGAAARQVEMLEYRRLLSATLISPVPAQNLITASGGTAQINLSTFLNDPSLTGGTVVEMQTPLGNIPLQLFDSRTPNTVANFVTYINNGEYTPTIVQRSVPGFVLQGGGTKPDGGNNAPLASLNSEAGISNTTGTIAMALSTGPNSGTNQWFINLADNPILDGTADGGPFTVFGTVIDEGMSVVSAIAALKPIINASAENFNWGSLPVINYSGSARPATVPPANLVTDNIVDIPAGQALVYSVVSADPSIVTASVSNGVLTLAAAPGAISGLTSVTVTATDLSGATATSTFSVGINEIATTTGVTASSPTAAAGIPVTLTATVTPASAGPSLTGTVTFFFGSTQVGSAVAVSGNDAVLTTSSLPSGADSITAVYSGDTRYTGSTSAPISVNVIEPTLTDSLAGPASSTFIATTPLKLSEKLMITAGSSGASGTHRATIQLSPNQTAADSVFTLSSESGKVKLKAGKAQCVSLKIPKTIPSTVAPGTYHVLITSTDTAGNVVTTDSGQAITVVAPVVDLTGSVVGPTSSKMGKKTAFTFTLTNSSSANVAAVGSLPFAVETSPDGLLADATALLSARKSINLKPGRSVKVTVAATLSSTTFLVVNLDPGSAVFPDDLNPANNIFSNLITVM